MSVLSMFGRNIRTWAENSVSFQIFSEVVRRVNVRSINPRIKGNYIRWKGRRRVFTSASSTLVSTTTNEEVSETTKSRLSSQRLVYDEMHLTRCNERCNDIMSRYFYLSCSLYFLLAHFLSLFFSISPDLHFSPRLELIQNKRGAV